jgi:TatA/E family protein of Tat protein translocase
VLLLIFESIGAPELLVILVVALVIFGPRKLPELSRSLGKSLAEFRRHSDEFKRTWEREVEMEATEKDARISQAMLPEDNSIMGTSRERSEAVMDAATTQEMPEPRRASMDSLPAAEDTSAVDAPAHPLMAAEAVAEDEAAAAPEPTRKRDWL